LLTDVLPNELRPPLPPSLAPPQTLAKTEYLTYVALVNAIDTIEDTLAILPPYGRRCLSPTAESTDAGRM
jgi:hypothetical protein